MPTIAESGQLNGVCDTFQSTESWTDAFPVCRLTGVGFAYNQQYRSNGLRQELHPYEDKSFHFQFNNNTYIYGLLDGFEGAETANFVATHLPAEVLLGKNYSTQNSDKEITDILRHAFIAVEKEYFQVKADLLAKKAALEYQIQGISINEACVRYPDIVNELANVTTEVSSGATAVVALLHYNRLHVANVGDCRAILCTRDITGQYYARQLSCDHDFSNNNELDRLSQLGLDVESLKHNHRIGERVLTRCIGNYSVKGGYKDCEYLKDATDEPIIAEPDINVKGSIAVDDTCQFLVLCSSGLCRALQEATNCDRLQVNIDIVRMVADEFNVQNNLTGVAQAVVNKICRLHQDQYFASVNTTNGSLLCQTIDDITLMVRNFNHQLRRLSSPHGPNPPINHRFDELRISVSEDNRENNATYLRNDSSTTLQQISTIISVDKPNDSIYRNTETNATSTTTNSTEFDERAIFDSRRVNPPLELDGDGKLAAYVDFGQFYRALNEAELNGTLYEFEFEGI